ncbi:MAG: universal stress protein [Rhodocyclaceae bacterium]|nr:universal stress protein [Rhodocyclaceae bacterium]
MPQRWLIAIDGSEHALKALTWAIAQGELMQEPPEIHLANVQVRLPADISRFVSRAAIEDFHREEGQRQLATALAQCQAAGVQPIPHVLVGEAAATLVDFAAAQGFDLIVVGTRGHTGVSGVILGSVATKIAHLAKTPLVLIR